MVNLQKAMGIFDRMPNNKVEYFLRAILYTLGEIEEGLQCSVPIHQRTGCVAHAKGILPDSNIVLPKISKINMFHGQEKCISYSYAVEQLKSCKNQVGHNLTHKTFQKPQVHFSFLKVLRDILYHLQLIIHRIYGIFLCTCLHKYVSPCQCPYVKTCSLILSQKKVSVLDVEPKIKPVKLVI